MGKLIEMLSVTTVNKLKPGTLFQAAEEDVKRLLAKGAAVLADAAGEVAAEVGAKVNDIAKKVAEGSTDEAVQARLTEIFSAIEKLPTIKESKELYGKDKKPTIKALSEVVGYQIDPLEYEQVIKLAD